MRLEDMDPQTKRTFLLVWVVLYLVGVAVMAVLGLFFILSEKAAEMVLGLFM